jgi:hypothetical protein
MPSLIQLCVLLLMLLGAGSRAWGSLHCNYAYDAAGHRNRKLFTSGSEPAPGTHICSLAAQFAVGRNAGSPDTSPKRPAWTYDATGLHIIKRDIGTPCDGPNRPSATAVVIVMVMAYEWDAQHRLFIVWMRDGPNVYAYVQQNPWSQFDAHGLFISAILEKLDEHVFTPVGEAIGSGIASVMPAETLVNVTQNSKAFAATGQALQGAKSASMTALNTLSPFDDAAKAALNGDIKGALVEAGKEVAGGKIAKGLGKVAKGGAAVIENMVKKGGDNLVASAQKNAGKAAELVDDVIPNHTPVVRGGSCTPEAFRNGSGVTVDGAGKMNGASVNSKPGLTVEELSEGIPHNKVGVTTVGDVRKAGGDVVSSPTTGNPNHATMSGVTPEKASELMTPVRQNPAKKK